MKKILAIIICILLCISVVRADSISLSELSTKELLELIDAAQVELGSREDADFKNRISQGWYVVDKDVKSGVYDFLCLSTKYDQSVRNNISFWTVASGDDGIDELLSSVNGIEIGDHITIILRDGMALKISNCSGILTEVEAPSWAP